MRSPAVPPRHRSPVYDGSLPARHPPAGAATAASGFPRLPEPTHADSVAARRRSPARRQGHLSLPNLRRVSPKTLSALLAKDDVEIPLLETLELSPEPDGGETDELVIPEALLKRQERERRR